jgi:hypothetical protein
MTSTTVSSWQAKRTDESRLVEEVLRRGGFSQVDSYRYNSAVIRVRVIDPRFENLPVEQRDALAEQHLKQLPERTQADIVTLLTFAPSEIQESSGLHRSLWMNSEFEDPSPSSLL